MLMLEYLSIKQRFLLGAALFIIALLLVNSYQLADYRHKVELAKTFVGTDAKFTAETGKIEKMRIVRQHAEEDAEPRTITFTFRLRAEKGRFEADIHLREDNGQWAVVDFSLKSLPPATPQTG